MLLSSSPASNVLGLLFDNGTPVLQILVDMVDANKVDGSIDRFRHIERPASRLH